MRIVESDLAGSRQEGTIYSETSSAPITNALTAPNPTRRPTEVAAPFDPTQVAVDIWNKYNRYIPIALTGWGIYKLYRGRRATGLTYVGSAVAFWIAKKIVTSLRSKTA